MKNGVWILLLLFETVCAKVITASYEVSFGIFGSMGLTTTQLEIRDDGSYTIRVEAKTTGIAKVLSNNRYEVYESRGRVEESKLIPESFVEMRQTNSNKSIKCYTFDHQKQTVWKETTEVVSGEEKTEKVRNDYYAQEDILSLFSNLNFYTQTRENQIFYTIGGHQKDGRIDVVFPKREELESIKKDLETNEGEILKVTLNDRIFASSNGEMLISLDDAGLANKAILKDVFLFGDIVAKRVRTIRGETRSSSDRPPGSFSCHRPLRTETEIAR